MAPPSTWRATCLNRPPGIKLSHIPYKGSNPALMDALAGNVDLLVSSLPSAMGPDQGRQAAPAGRYLGQAQLVAADVPTVAESGFRTLM